MAGNQQNCSQDSTCGDAGTFAWADAQGPEFVSSGANQFLVRAAGGVGINTNAPFANKLTVQGSGGAVSGFVPQSGSATVIQGTGTATFLEIAADAAHESGVLFNLGTGTPDGGVFYNAGGNPNGISIRTGGNHPRMSIDSGGNVFLNRASLGAGVFQVGNSSLNGNGAYLSVTGVWTDASSRTFKDAFTTEDKLDLLGKVLALPVTTWFYKGNHDEGRHIGPMAEDFAQAFGLGSNEHRYRG